MPQPTQVNKRQNAQYTSGYTEGYKAGYVNGYTAGYSAGKALQSTILRKNLAEKKALKTQLLKDIEEIKSSLPALQAALKESEDERMKYMNEVRVEEQRKATEFSEFERLRSQHNGIDAKIRGLRDNSERIVALQKKVDDLNQNMQELQRKKNILDRRMSGIETKVGAVCSSRQFLAIGKA